MDGAEREIKHILCKYCEAAVAKSFSNNQKVDGSIPDSSRLHIIVSVRKTVNVCECNLQLKALTQLE